MVIILLVILMLLVLFLIINNNKERSTLTKEAGENLFNSAHAYYYMSKRKQRDNNRRRKIKQTKIKRIEESCLVKLHSPKIVTKTKTATVNSEEIAESWLASSSSLLEKKYASATTEDYILFSSDELPKDKKSWKIIADRLAKEEGLEGKVENSGIKLKF